VQGSPSAPRGPWPTNRGPKSKSVALSLQNAAVEAASGRGASSAAPQLARTVCALANAARTASWSAPTPAIHLDLCARAAYIAVSSTASASAPRRRHARANSARRHTVSRPSPRPCHRGALECRPRRSVGWTSCRMHQCGIPRWTLGLSLATSRAGRMPCGWVSTRIQPRRSPCPAPAQAPTDITTMDL